MTTARKPTKKQREAAAAKRRQQATAEFAGAAKILALCIAAFLLDYLPVLDNVLGLLETYYHELGHAMMAELTGRTARVMELNWNGSGSVTHAGHSDGMSWVPRSITAWFGYAGAIAFGAYLYWLMTLEDGQGRLALWIFVGLVLVTAFMAGDGVFGRLIGVALVLPLVGYLLVLPKQRARDVLWVFAYVVVLTMLWLARDLNTWIIGVLLAGTLGATGFVLGVAVGPALYPGKMLVRFIGVALIILSMKSAWALWGIQPPHDAHTLASTFIPFQFVWILSWELFGLGALYFLFRREIDV